MDSFEDSADISLSASGSRLLSESLVFSSHTGIDTDDLSMSELSVADRPHVLEKRFSLFASPPSEPSTPRQEGHLTQHEEEGFDEEESSDSHEAEDKEAQKVHRARVREEKLQSDIFILRKMNASFALLNDALLETESANEVRNALLPLRWMIRWAHHGSSQRIARRLEQTDALLNKYVEILSKSEDITRLIFDEEWHGADEVRMLISSSHSILRLELYPRTKKFSNGKGWWKEKRLGERQKHEP
jgi:hypothetical protein